MSLQVNQRNDLIFALRNDFDVTTLRSMLPNKAKAFLAARLHLEADEAVWNEADLEDWEIHAQQRARDLLELRQPLGAVAALRQRKERTSNSPLPVVEREALITALTTMQSFYSVYSTTQIKRLTMRRIYGAIFGGVLDLDLPAETIISIRKILKFDSLED
jgi:hypothetical protein